MAKSLLIGQGKIAAALATAVESSRVAHAYLFHGPEGAGKRAAAIDFACSLLCERPLQGAACRECNACSRAFKLGHPDLHVMMPAPNNVSFESVAERIKILAANPYAVVDFERRPSLDAYDAQSNKQVIYSKDDIGQELRRQMSLAPVEGGYRVAVMTDADRMRTEAANAFLKLLEEPGDRTVFVLTSDRPDRMLATIRSRCQLQRFSRLADEEVASALIDRRSLDEGAAQTLARMADGSYSRALELASNQELISTRTLVVDYLRAAYANDSDLVVGFAEQFNRMGRETLKFFLQLTLGWLRDLLLYRTLGDEAPIINLDQFTELRRFSENLPDARLEAMVDLVDEASRLVERNMNLRLTFIVLAQALRQAMRGESVSGLVVSLTDEPLAV